MKIKRLYKTGWTVIVCLAAAMLFAIMPALAGSGENEGDVLVVGIPVDRFPLFYTDPNTGEAVGIGVDLMRTAAENAGYKTVFKSIGDKTLREALDDPAFDVVMPFGSALPSAAGKETIVSDNLMQTPFTLLTNGRWGIPKLNELKVGM